MNAAVDLFAQVDFGGDTIDAGEDATLRLLSGSPFNPTRPSTWAPTLDAEGALHPGWDANCNVGCFTQSNARDEARALQDAGAQVPGEASESTVAEAPTVDSPALVLALV